MKPSGYSDIFPHSQGCHCRRVRLLCCNAMGYKTDVGCQTEEKDRRLEKAIARCSGGRSAAKEGKRMITLSLSQWDHSLPFAEVRNGHFNRYKRGGKRTTWYMLACMKALPSVRRFPGPPAVGTWMWVCALEREPNAATLSLRDGRRAIRPLTESRTRRSEAREKANESSQ